MNRRDLLLNEMKITQWQLTNPQALKGVAQIRLHQAVEFVVICEQDHRHSRFFADLLHMLGLSATSYQWFTPEQALRLTVEHSLLFYLIMPASQAVSFQQKLNEQARAIWQVENWQTLMQPSSKRQLWQQIQPFCQVQDNR